MPLTSFPPLTVPIVGDVATCKEVRAHVVEYAASSETTVEVHSIRRVAKLRCLMCLSRFMFAPRISESDELCFLIVILRMRSVFKPAKKRTLAVERMT